MLGGVGLHGLDPLLAAVVAQSQDAIFVCGPDGLITVWNQRAAELYGYSAQEMIGASPSVLLPEGAASVAEEADARAAEEQPVTQYMTTRQRKDGWLVNVSLTVSPIRADGGRLLGTVALARDISPLVRLQEQFSESERRMNEAQALAHVGSWDWDLALEFPSWTDELCRIYGYPEGHTPTAEDLLARVHPLDREQVAAKVEEAKGGVDNAVEYRIELPDGQLRHVQARHHSRFDEAGEPIGVHGVVQDVTERQHYEAELRRLATHDELTGLPNRRTYEQRLELEVARCRRGGATMTLAVLDVDRFKAVNDTHGHQVGDAVLCQVGELLGRQVREVELLARIGGEEFAWILQGADAAGARVAVERARSAIAAHRFDTAGHVTISAGICTWLPGMDGPALYRSADMALLEAKRAGRDRVVTAVDLGVEIRANTLVA